MLVVDVQSPPGYAVVDVETTGLSPSYHHKVVEIAVVQLDQSGVVEREWTTLVNPGRDVGARHIHGITAEEVLHAPTFADLTGYLGDLLQGRVFVAHNASFDLRFIEAEFDAAGLDVDIDQTNCLCTMSLASQFLPSTSRRLEICCEAAGVVHQDAHSALGDARATAALFSYYLARVTPPPPWSASPIVVSTPGRHRAPNLVQAVLRGTARQRMHWMTGLADRLPAGDDPKIESYLALLDSALLDRYLAVTEEDALLESASYLGLDRDKIISIHRSYLQAVACAAWEDRVFTDDELADLHALAPVLGLAVQDVVDAIAVAKTTSAPVGNVNGFQLVAGDIIVLTGDMRRPRDEWSARLEIAGYVAAETVTKKTKVLVAADPDSQSGKARTARRYGLPIINEQRLESLVS